MKTSKYVLDSYALLAYFQAEPGGERVRQLLKEAYVGRSEVFLSVINLGEIYYIVARRRGRDAAISLVEDLSRLPVDVVDAGTKRVLAAADIKAQHRVSYADAFAAATAEELTATLVTGDPEMKEVESRVPVLWL